MVCEWKSVHLFKTEVMITFGGLSLFVEGYIQCFIFIYFSLRGWPTKGKKLSFYFLYSFSKLSLPFMHLNLALCLISCFLKQYLPLFYAFMPSFWFKKRNQKFDLRGETSFGKFLKEWVVHLLNRLFNIKLFFLKHSSYLIFKHTKNLRKLVNSLSG